MIKILSLNFNSRQVTSSNNHLHIISFRLRPTKLLYRIRSLHGHKMNKVYPIRKSSLLRPSPTLGETKGVSGQ